MYALIYSLFIIFTLLVYLRGNALSLFEFVLIVILLCHILWILYSFSKKIQEGFDDNVGEEQGVDVEDEEGLVSWRDVAELPLTTRDRILPPIKQIVLGMKGKYDPDDPATNIDLSDEFVAENRELLSGFSGIEIYKDANYALSKMHFSEDEKIHVLYKMLKDRSFGLLDMSNVKIKFPKEE